MSSEHCITSSASSAYASNVYSLRWHRTGAIRTHCELALSALTYPEQEEKIPHTLTDSEKQQQKKMVVTPIDFGGNGAFAVWIGPMGCLVAKWRQHYANDRYVGWGVTFRQIFL